MADLNYTLSIEDQQALRSLRAVQKQVQQTNQVFGELKSAIAGLAIGAFINSAVNLASALNNISVSTGIALDAVVGFGQAMQANGGTIDRAVDGLSDLTKNIGDAARGSSELQNAFGLAGVSLQDIATLSEQDILRKTITGLQQIPDSATRTATAMKLFGESVKGVDLAGLNRDLDGFTRAAGPNADAIRAAADAQKNFGIAAGVLQVELLAALKPISELAARIATATDAFKEFFRLAVDIALIVGAFFAITRAAQLAATVFLVLRGAIGDLLASLSGLARTFGSILTQIRAVWREFAITDKTVIGLGKRISYLKQEIPLLGSALAVLGTAAAVAWTAVKRLFGAGDTAEAENQSAAETKRLQALNDRAAAQQRLTDRVVIANAEERKAIEATIRAMQTTNGEMVKRISNETSLLRATEETRFAVQTMSEVEQNYLKAIEPLQTRILEIRKKGKEASETERALLPELEAGIARITAQYQQQVPAIQTVIAERIKEMQIQKELELSAERLNKLAQNRATVESSVRDIMLNGQQRINDAYNQAAQEALPGIYRQLRQIADEENRIAEAAKARVAEQFGEDTAGLNQAISEIDAAVAVIIQRRQEAAYAISQDQTSFVTGWQRAFDEYVTAANNGADQARNIFSTVTKGMEDAFVNFARTGKLSVKDLFRSIVETILRSQVQQLLAKTFGGMGTSGGGSLLGSLFGNLFAGFFAKGGRIPAGQVGVVGEAGPEFVSGPASVTPMAAQPTQVVYNINAVDASSFRSLVASDPEFLFAVTEQGRRRIPSQRR